MGQLFKPSSISLHFQSLSVIQSVHFWLWVSMYVLRLVFQLTQVPLPENGFLTRQEFFIAHTKWWWCHLPKLLYSARSHSWGIFPTFRRHLHTPMWGFSCFQLSESFILRNTKDGVSHGNLQLVGCAGSLWGGVPWLFGEVWGTVLKVCILCWWNFVHSYICVTVPNFLDRHI